MKREWLFIIILDVLILSFDHIEAVTVTYNDGGVHQISSSSTDYIEVRNSFWDESTTVNLVSGGSVWYLYSYQNSRINILDGSIKFYLIARDNSHVTMSAGTVGYLQAHDNSHVWMSGGSLQSAEIQNKSSVLMSGGEIRSHVNVTDDSIFNISGGFVDNVYGYIGSEVNLKGGTIRQDLFSMIGSHATVTGGQISGFFDIREGTNAMILGTSFILDQHPVSGIITNPLDTVNYGHLTGLYLDGQAIDINIKMDPHASIMLVPEPSMIILLSVGSVWLFKFRKRDL